MIFARLSKHNYSQEVRLPKQYRMPGEKVKVSKYGNGLLLEPVSEGFESLFNSLDMFSDDFMTSGRHQPSIQSRDDVFV